MTDDRSARGPHDAHDLALVAAHATGDATAEAAARAEELLASCAACRDLAADVRAIRLATRAMPAPARQRDFRITAADAAQLRPATAWGRMVEGLLAPRGYGRQLSGALMAIGFAGLLVTAIPGMLPGQAPGTATLATRDSTTSAGAPQGNDFAAPQAVSGPGGSAAGGGTESAGGAGNGTTAGDAKGAPVPSASGQPGSGPAAIATAGAAPAAPGDRGVAPGASGPPIAPDQAAAPGASTTAAQPQASTTAGGRATDTTAASQPIAWAPFLAALSGLAVVAGLGLFLVRRRVVARR